MEKAEYEDQFCNRQSAMKIFFRVSFNNRLTSRFKVEEIF